MNCHACRTRWHAIRYMVRVCFVSRWLHVQLDAVGCDPWVQLRHVPIPWSVEHGAWSSMGLARAKKIRRRRVCIRPSRRVPCRWSTTPLSGWRPEVVVGYLADHFVVACHLCHTLHTYPQCLLSSVCLSVGCNPAKTRCRPPVRLPFPGAAASDRKRARRSCGSAGSAAAVCMLGTILDLSWGHAAR